MSASVVSVRLRGHGRISLKRKLPSARSDGLPPDASSASAFGCVYERRLTLHPEARERPWLVIGGPALRMHTENFGIEAGAAWLDDTEDGEAHGWAAGEARTLYETSAFRDETGGSSAHAAERVAPGWWAGSTTTRRSRRPSGAWRGRWWWWSRRR